MNYTNILIYSIYLLCGLYAIILLYLKWQSPFWFHQPVYHTYELYPRLLLWNKRPYWKRKRPLKMGIFCDIEHIETWQWDRFTHWEPLCNLLQGYYLDNDYALFHCTEKYLRSHFYGASWISCYREQRLMEPEPHESGSGPHRSVVLQKWASKPDYTRFYGCILSRPVVVYFLHYPESSTTIQYWDMLCVHEQYQKKHLSRNLIQTHIYSHNVQTGIIPNGFCFTKHGSLCTGVVPLVQYSTYTFVLRKVRFHQLPRNYRIYCLNRNHLDLWRSIYYQMTRQFDICVLPPFEYTVEWLTNERYVIYATVYKIQKVEHVHGVYVLENTHRSWLDDTISQPHIIKLVASMNFEPKSGQFHHDHDPLGILFFRGFVNCLQEFLLMEKDSDHTKGILEIPMYSHNGFILDKWREKYELHMENTSAFYLYNLVYPSSPVQYEKIVILA